ncbi:MAG TPA: APC family permease [Terriglobales bacterium]|nr:APC family permease [Terriglobales bacterium]
MNATQQSDLLRDIGRWSLVGLMLNATIGSAVFGLPSLVAQHLGGAALWAYPIAAAGMGVIMACFAEVASRFREAGGPYLYAREAFGRFAGLQIGWLAWLVRIAAAAANANLFVQYAAEFWPQAGHRLPRLTILVLLLGILAIINYRGVRAGAGASNVFIVGKLIPLVLFALIGGAFAAFGPETAPPLASRGSGADWFAVVILLVYAYGGFEAVLIPMSEARDPQRDAPLALGIALASAAFLYMLVQYVVIAVLPGPESSTRPLADAARVFLGAPGAALISLGALLSVYGYFTATMLVTPRLTYAFAQAGDFPRWFAAVHPRFHTPHVSILVFTALVFLLAVIGDFRWNLTLSAVARLFTYAAICGAVVVFRRKPSAPPAVFRLPAAWLFVAAGIAFCGILVTRMGEGELAIIAATTTLAFIHWLVAVLFRNTPAQASR